MINITDYNYFYNTKTSTLYEANLSNTEISVVIPVFNEAENIPIVYERTKAILKRSGVSREFIFVNDGSSDNSLEVLKKLSDRDYSVKYLDLTRNFGQQAALTAGMDYSCGKAVITMDCDLQDPPEVISEMIRKWKSGFDTVYTRRRQRNDKFFKKYSALLYYKILDKFSDIKIAGNIGDFRLVSRAVLNELRNMKEKSRYLRGMVAWLGFNYTIVEYDRPERLHGKTGFSLLKMMRLGMAGILNFSLLPLRLGLVIGLFTVITGFAFFAYILFDYLIFNEVYPLYKWLSVITFIFIGFLFILIWILAEYVGQISVEAKGRPIYVIRDKENIEIENSVTDHR